MDRERDMQRLREYEAELGEAEKGLSEYQAEVDALTSIVTGLRTRLGLNGLNQIRQPVETLAPRRRRGARGLKTVLRDALHELGRLDGDSALEYLATLPEFSDRMPNRNTVVSRLGDLARDGEAVGLGGGEYESTRSNGRVGSPQLVPDERPDS